VLDVAAAPSDLEAAWLFLREFPRAHSVIAAMSLASPSARPRFAAVSLLALAGSLGAEGSTEVLPCRLTIACTAQIEAPPASP
jgi:hypothetical protein